MAQNDEILARKRAKILSAVVQEPLAIQNNAFSFVEGNRLPLNTAGSGVFGFVQNIAKRRGALYYFVIDVVSPVKASRRFRSLLAHILDKYTDEHVIVNYGSGPGVVGGRKDIINSDQFAFDEVDLVFETTLPFRAETVDLLLNIAVLEHMRTPQVAVTEIFRCLKPGGEVLVFAPFLQPVHAAPDDYFRWTAAGLRELFKDFSVEEVGIGAGPTSGFLWVFQEWLAVLLSFGSLALRDLVLLLIMFLTFPFKYIDALLEMYPSGGKVASGFYIHARKPYIGRLQ